MSIPGFTKSPSRTPDAALIKMGYSKHATFRKGEERDAFHRLHNDGYHAFSKPCGFRRYGYVQVWYGRRRGAAS